GEWDEHIRRSRYLFLIIYLERARELTAFHKDRFLQNEEPQQQLRTRQSFSAVGTLGPTEFHQPMYNQTRIQVNQPSPPPAGPLSRVLNTIPLQPPARSHQVLYLVSFKACRADVFYVQEGTGLRIKAGDLVIVEAD